MSKVNPVTLVLLMILLVLASLKIHQVTKQEFESSRENYNSFVELVSNYNSTNNIWHNKKRANQIIKKHLQSSKLHKVTTIESKSNYISLIIDSKVDNNMEKFFNKMFNDKFKFRKIEVLNDKTIIEVEL